MRIIKSGKQKNGGKNRTTKSRKNLEEKETYKYLGILRADTIKQAEMKKIKNKNKKEYLKRTKKTTQNQTT